MTTGEARAELKAAIQARAAAVEAATSARRAAERATGMVQEAQAALEKLDVVEEVTSFALTDRVKAMTAGPGNRRLMSAGDLAARAEARRIAESQVRTLQAAAEELSRRCDAAKPALEESKRRLLRARRDVLTEVADAIAAEHAAIQAREQRLRMLVLAISAYRSVDETGEKTPIPLTARTRELLGVAQTLPDREESRDVWPVVSAFVDALALDPDAPLEAPTEPENATAPEDA